MLRGCLHHHPGASIQKGRTKILCALIGYSNEFYFNHILFLSILIINHHIPNMINLIPLCLLLTTPMAKAMGFFGLVETRHQQHTS